MEKKVMRCGFTTGSCAAAAAKAAALRLKKDKEYDYVRLKLPNGDELNIPVVSVSATVDGARATVIKDAGDDPDITNGMQVIADVSLIGNNSGEVEIIGGEGVGIVTKDGLSVPVGQAAINPVPRGMIIAALKEVFGDKASCRVTISLPDGVKLAKRTLNPILGIEGGLSVIGTSGIVRPMSEEAFKDSLVPQISVAKAAGHDTIVFVPGKIGETAAVARYGLPQTAIVQTSNFIGHMLEHAAEQKIKRVLLFGHLGKIVKIAAGIFHTHNRIADARMETLGAYLAVLGAPPSLVAEVLQTVTTEAAIPLIEAHRLEKVYTLLAKQASLRAERYVFQELTVGTAMVTLKGDLLGLDDTARQIGEALGWNIK